MEKHLIYMQYFKKSRKHYKSSYKSGPAPWASCLLMCSFPGAVSLCEHCFKMILRSAALSIDKSGTGSFLKWEI